MTLWEFYKKFSTCGRVVVSDNNTAGGTYEHFENSTDVIRWIVRNPEQGDREVTFVSADVWDTYPDTCVTVITVK